MTSDNSVPCNPGYICEESCSPSGTRFNCVGEYQMHTAGVDPNENLTVALNPKMMDVHELRVLVGVAN